MSKIHCKLQGFWRGGGDPEVSPRSPPPGSAAGAACLYNLRLPTEGLRQGHGPPGPWAGARIEGLPPMPPTPEFVTCDAFGISTVLPHGFLSLYLKTGSETPERQQQSSLCQAKNRSKRGFRTMMAAQSLVSVRFEKTETPARFEPMPSKKRADRMLHVTFGTHKKKQSFGSETPERQQQSSLCQAKNRSKRGFRTMAAPSLVSVRFEKTETPARFEPMPSKKHADRMLHVTFGTHKKQSLAPKQPNASMSRAHAKQKTRRKNASRDFWSP